MIIFIAKWLTGKHYTTLRIQDLTKLLQQAVGSWERWQLPARAAGAWPHSVSSMLSTVHCGFFCIFRGLVPVWTSGFSSVHHLNSHTVKSEKCYALAWVQDGLMFLNHLSLLTCSLDFQCYLPGGMTLPSSHTAVSDIAHDTSRCFKKCSLLLLPTVTKEATAWTMERNQFFS